MRVQVAAEQFQPVPDMDANVIPAVAMLSVTVTVPLEAKAAAAFETVMVKAAPCWPWVKLAALAMLT